MTFKEFCVTLTEFLNNNPAIMWLALLFIILDYSTFVYRALRTRPTSKNTYVYYYHIDKGYITRCEVHYCNKKKMYVVVPNAFVDDFNREADSIEEDSNGRKSNTDTRTDSGTDTLSHSDS